MLSLWLVGMVAVSSPLVVQLEEIADVPAALEASLLQDLQGAVSARAEREITVRDCRRGGCKPKDAAADEETVHVLVFGAPTRISITMERLGRGRVLRGSRVLPVSAPDQRAELDALVAEVFPNSTRLSVDPKPEVLPVSRLDESTSSSGVSALTVGSLVVSGAAFAGAVVFAFLAHDAQSSLAAKEIYDDEVPGLNSAVQRDGALALSLLGVGVGAAIVATISEVTR